MRVAGLNARQCRGLLVLEQRGALSELELAKAIGPYATNTITSLIDKKLVAGERAQLALTDAGRAIAKYLEGQLPRQRAQ